MCLTSTGPKKDPIHLKCSLKKSIHHQLPPFWRCMLYTGTHIPVPVVYRSVRVYVTSLVVSALFHDLMSMSNTWMCFAVASLTQLSALIKMIIGCDQAVRIWKIFLHPPLHICSHRLLMILFLLLQCLDLDQLWNYFSVKFCTDMLLMLCVQ